MTTRNSAEVATAKNVGEQIETRAEPVVEGGGSMTEDEKKTLARTIRAMTGEKRMFADFETVARVYAGNIQNGSQEAVEVIESLGHLCDELQSELYELTHNQRRTDND